MKEPNLLNKARVCFIGAHHCQNLTTISIVIIIAVVILVCFEITLICFSCENMNNTKLDTFQAVISNMKVTFLHLSLVADQSSFQDKDYFPIKIDVLVTMMVIKR